MSQNLRMEFLRANKLPTQTQVRESLGNPLAELFFASVDKRLRKPLGLQPIMEGVATESLWLSPSDILIGKVMMTPPMPTRRVVRALTHEGILEIGSACLYKLENEARIVREKALMELQARLETHYQEQLNKAVEEVRREEQAKADKHIEQLLDECRQDMEVALAENKRSIARKTAVRIQEERAEVHGLLEDQLVNGLEMQHEMLQREFSGALQRLTRDLNAGFRAQKELTAATFEWRLDLQRFQCVRYVEFLRVSLEAQNAADVSYAVCRERQRCQADHRRLLQEMEEEAQRLGQIIVDKNRHLAEAALAAQRQQVEIGRWRTHLRQVIHEFQKFVNFALRAVPGQAEFLLSIERLMKLETAPEDTGLSIDAGNLLKKSVSIIKDYCGLQFKDSLLSASAPGRSQVQSDVDPSKEKKISNAPPPKMSMTPSAQVGNILQTIVKEAVVSPEELVGPLVHGIIDRIMPGMTLPGKADASTQIPSFTKTPCIDKIISPTPTVESVYNYDDELLDEFAAKRVKVVTSSSVFVAKAMVECLVSTAEKEVGIEDQDCAFCEIQDQQTLNVCQKDSTGARESKEGEPGEKTAEGEMEAKTVAEGGKQNGFLARGLVGEGGKEHEQDTEEFIQDRVQSMLMLFHDHPSLTSLFISN